MRGDGKMKKEIIENATPHPNCGIKESCYCFVFYKYPENEKRLIEHNKKLHVLEDGKVLEEILVKHPTTKECPFCSLYHHVLHGDRDLEQKLELPKKSIPPILGSDLSSGTDWKTYFYGLGIPKKVWDDESGFFDYLAIKLLKLTKPEDEEKRKGFDEIIARAYGDDEDNFWHAMLLNLGLNWFWYDQQEKITIPHQNIHQVYRKMDKSGRKKRMSQEDIELAKRETSLEFEALNIPLPVFSPMYQYDEAHRPEDKGYNQFVLTLIDLLSNAMPQAAIAQIIQVACLFLDGYMGIKDSPSKIRKIFLRARAK
jgi:hypothetical protein